MCCFSQPVEHVFNTEIYARASRGAGQFVVYSMHFVAKNELAMILPLPVKQPADEEALRFINLQEFPNFFRELQSGFPQSRRYGAAGGAGGRPSATTLKVVKVGAFSASFVPSVADFERLDRRFRLPEGTWESLPAYRDFGFAVFKLDHRQTRVHPMAFEFNRQNSRELFFPTVHIHDGKVHEHAHFDHVLYCQADIRTPGLMQWEESSRHAGAFMSLPVQQSLVRLSDHVYRREITGRHKNTDTVL